MARPTPANAKREMPPPGRYSEDRHMWLDLKFFEAATYVGMDDHEDAEPGEGVRLGLKAGNTRLMLNLTALTADELQVFRELINRTIDLAIPTAELRDQHAQEAWENGDTSYTRMYRQIPRLFERPRKKRQHGEQLPVGPDRAAGSEAEPDAGELRRDSGVVAEREPSDVGTQDNGS